MKYTPGPWMAWDTGSGMSVCPKSCEDELIPNVSAFANEICRVIPKPDHPQFNDLWEIGKANANLISSAPELLEILETIVKDFDGNWEHYEQAKNIIAKAKGETNE